MRVDGGQETILRTVRMDYKDARCEISHTALSSPTRQRRTTFIFVGASPGGDPLRGAGRVEGDKDISRSPATLTL